METPTTGSTEPKIVDTIVTGDVDPTQTGVDYYNKIEINIIGENLTDNNFLTKEGLHWSDKTTVELIKGETLGQLNNPTTFGEENTPTTPVTAFRNDKGDSGRITYIGKTLSGIDLDLIWTIVDSDKETWIEESGYAETSGVLGIGFAGEQFIPGATGNSIVVLYNNASHIGIHYQIVKHGTLEEIPVVVSFISTDIDAGQGVATDLANLVELIPPESGLLKKDGIIYDGRPGVQGLNGSVDLPLGGYLGAGFLSHFDYYFFSPAPERFADTYNYPIAVRYDIFGSSLQAKVLPRLKNRIELSYQDETGKTIRPSQVFSGFQDEKYLVETINLPNYRLVDIKTDESNANNPRLQFIYRPIYNIKLRFIDESGKELLAPLTYRAEQGYSFTHQPSKIAGFQTPDSLTRSIQDNLEYNFIYKAEESKPVEEEKPESKPEDKETPTPETKPEDKEPSKPEPKPEDNEDSKSTPESNPVDKETGKDEDPQKPSTKPNSKPTDTNPSRPQTRPTIRPIVPNRPVSLIYNVSRPHPNNVDTNNRPVVNLPQPIHQQIPAYRPIYTNLVPSYLPYYPTYTGNRGELPSPISHPQKTDSGNKGKDNPADDPFLTNTGMNASEKKRFLNYISKVAKEAQKNYGNDLPKINQAIANAIAYPVYSTSTPQKLTNNFGAKPKHLDSKNEELLQNINFDKKYKIDFPHLGAPIGTYHERGFIQNLLQFLASINPERFNYKDVFFQHNSRVGDILTTDGSKDKRTDIDAYILNYHPDYRNKRLDIAITEFYEQEDVYSVRDKLYEEALHYQAKVNRQDPSRYSALLIPTSFMTLGAVALFMWGLKDKAKKFWDDNWPKVKESSKNIFEAGKRKWDSFKKNIGKLFKNFGKPKPKILPKTSPVTSSANRAKNPSVSLKKNGIVNKVIKPAQNFVTNKIVKPVQRTVTKIVKPVQNFVTNKIVKPVQQFVTNKVIKPVQRTVAKVVKPVQRFVSNKVVKPAQRAVAKIVKPVQRFVSNKVVKPVKSFVKKVFTRKRRK